jgi:hypothetical protein
MVGTARYAVLFLAVLNCFNKLFSFQVTNGPVFRLGIGTENGEYMELTNAYLSRFASVTKHMGEARKTGAID